MPKAKKSFILRGYIEQTGEEVYFAICLTINVCARGRSMAEAQNSLTDAVGLYLEGAVKDGDLEQWVPRRAPLYHYLRYWTLWLRIRVIWFSPPYDAQLMARVVHA